MKNLKYLLMAGLSFGIFGGLQVTANAASQYSAKRSHEVKLIWRRSMGTHAFKAPTGARFSKHLGVCYGYNPQTADVTWYTDAHEKLYLKNLRMYSIYYHVTSKSGLQGWIWKGYMKPTDSSDANNDNGSSKSASKNDTEYSGALDNTKVSSFDQQVDALFPNTVHNKKIDMFISLWYSSGSGADIGSNNFIADVKRNTGLSNIQVINLNHKLHAPITITQVTNFLKSQGINPEQFSGYQIGSFILTDGVMFGVGDPGDGMIILGK